MGKKDMSIIAKKMGAITGKRIDPTLTDSGASGD